MQQHEKDKLEERIVAYFEGSLDSQSGKQLLAEVAKSTESRALFKSHETLNTLINAARVPMEVPLEAKRSIAERIPGLIAFIPGLLGGAQALPILSQSANPFLTFFAKIPLSTAISVGTSVAVLTTAGVVIKNKLDDNAAAERKAKIAVVQNQTANKDAGNQYYMAPLPARDLATPEVGGANTTASASGVPNAAPSNVGGSGTGTNAVSPSTVPTSSGSGVSSVISSSGLEEKPHATPLHHIAEGAIASSIVNGASASSEAVHASRTDRLNKATQRKAEVTPKAVEQNPNVGQQPTANETGVKSALEAPVVSIGDVTPTTIPVARAADMPLPRSAMMGTISTMGSGMILRPFLMSEVRFLVLPSVGNNPVGTPSESRAGISRIGNFGVGLDAILTDDLALRLEVGTTSFAQIRELQPVPTTIQGIADSTLNKYTYSSKVELASAGWTTAGLVYSLDLGLPFLLFASADVGAAWMPAAPGFMAGAGLSSEFDLGSHFTIKPGVSYNAAWIPEAQSQVPDDFHPQGIIVHNELSKSGALLNSSFGINVGFLFRF